MRTITNKKRPSGFTLIELSIVILIIGLLMAFVLAASAAGLESARVRATQALITKLNVGLEERLEALLSVQVPINGAHRFLAAIPLTNLTNPDGSAFTATQLNAVAWGLTSDQRAAAIARLDQIKAEFPDVFFVDPNYLSTDPLHPVKFGGMPYNPGNDSVSPSDNHFILPIGNSVVPAFRPNTFDPTTGNAINTGPGDFVPATSNILGTGINGASYEAAASLYKLIGFTPRGCDMVDNNNDGVVDDINEGTQNPDGSANAAAQQKLATFLANHSHKTARSEMLYALLVEGVGPLGSVFNREDFRDNEVKDTDGDGVPEFVDGWGEPIQFYRWPIAHQSGLQKGDAPYGPFETRQQNPLDPNGQLVTLSWWCDNSSPAQPSMKNGIVQNLFVPLADPNWVTGLTAPTNTWDRSGASGRRAYLTKFLIVSGGPDRQVGLPRLTDTFIRANTATTTTQAIIGQVGFSNGAFTFTVGESWALALPWSSDPTVAQALLPSWANSPYDPSLDTDYTVDDITNQELQNKAGGFQ